MCADACTCIAIAPCRTSCRCHASTTSKPNWKRGSSKKHRSSSECSFTLSRERIIEDRTEIATMVEARATWVDQDRFVGQASSGHAIVVDAAQVKSGNSPMELVLIGLCGCTATDVVSILRKKREPFTSLEVRAQAERAPNPPSVYSELKLIYRVGGKVSRKAVEDAVRLSKEKYCSVSAMLEKTAKIAVEIEYMDE